MELIQNAEDAGHGLDTHGLMEVSIGEKRLKVSHDGRPFTGEDVRALCGIRSSKKPEKGSLGYLGIGFKSVFKVTDSPEIYSGGFQFKFDRNYKDWAAVARETPWHVIPIWLAEASEEIQGEKTTFIIPYRDPICHETLSEDVRRLSTDLYLFLRWLREIRVVDERSGTTSALRNEGETADGITTLSHDGKQQRFKFFRSEVKVPEPVREDRLTQEFRSNVACRAISIAFALDENGNLDPSPRRAMYGGVYSFLPLGEARSGVKFTIQADFLVQPGRDAINYEAPWNHWLMDEIVRLCEVAIQSFQQHDRWKYQFLRAFEFDNSVKWLEPYAKLFGPRLIEPLEKILKESNIALAVDGTWTTPDKVVRIDEQPEAVDALVTAGLLKGDEIAPAMAGAASVKALDKSVDRTSSDLIKDVDRWDWFANEEFFGEKARTTDAPDWFRSLYIWLQKYPSIEEYQERRRTYKRQKHYDSIQLVLAADGQLLKGGEISIPDLPTDDPILRELSTGFQLPKRVLDPDILVAANDDAERKVIRGFLTGMCGVQVYDAKNVCEDVFLPKILTKSPQPSPVDLLRYTVHCQEYLGTEMDEPGEFWVLTKERDVKPAREVFFPTEFKPETNWERNHIYLPGIGFAASDYIQNVKTIEELEHWRDFLRKGGIKDNPADGVEEFAVNFAEEKLKKRYAKLIRVEKLNYGYDLEAETVSGQKAQIEVKGQAGEDAVTLTGNETDAADKHGETYHVCVVSGIPEHPVSYLVSNPAQVGKKDKLTIPIEMWKARRWP
ncbi:MAG TPA: DUF3883 domain-containing protein [Terriglobia bacterium]|nr:DUF3883 domain-containing protein [Terriglobia bacterium]